MDAREDQVFPLGILQRLFNFLMKIIEAQSLKTVTLGKHRPICNDLVNTERSLQQELALLLVSLSRSPKSVLNSLNRLH
ncbi:unnamed protein product [Malus baccata var. baccata]